MPEPAGRGGLWREFGAQLGAAAIAVGLVVAALLLGSTFLLYVALLVLCAVAVLLVVANGIP